MKTIVHEHILFQLSIEYHIKDNESSLMNEIYYDEDHDKHAIYKLDGNYYVFNNINKDIFYELVHSKNKDQYLNKLINEHDYQETTNLDIASYQDGIYRFDDFE